MSHMADTTRDILIQAWFDNMQNMQRAMKGRFHAELVGETLSMGQLALLYHIDHSQPTSSKQIAADTHNSKSAVAQLLDGLDKAGLVVRQNDPEDRRIVYVRLSETGTKKVTLLKQRRKAFFMELAGALTDQELATMVDVQRKMVTWLETK